MLVICRCCCCGSMETLSGLHHSKSNCNLVVKDHFDSLSDLFYSFVIDEEATSLGLLCCTQVLLTSILCLVSKLCSYLHYLWKPVAFTSVAMICFYSYVLLAGGNPPPKKAKAAAWLSWRPFTQASHNCTNVDRVTVFFMLVNTEHKIAL